MNKSLLSILLVSVFTIGCVNTSYAPNVVRKGDAQKQQYVEIGRAHV